MTTPDPAANSPAAEPELRDKVLSALRWTVIGRFAAQLFRWCSTIIVIRFLVPADYGLMSMVEVVFSVLMTVAAAGLADGLVREKNITKDTERGMLTALIAVAVALAVAQWFAAPLLAAWFNEPMVVPVMRVLCVALLLQPWFTLPMALLKQRMQFREIALAEFVAALIAAIVTLTLAVAGFGVWALVIGQLVAILGRITGFAIACGELALPGKPGPELISLLKFGALVTATSILWTFYAKVDVFIGGRALDATKIGFYAVAMHLASLAMSRLMPLVHQVGFPSYSQLNNDAVAAGYYLRKTMRLMALVVCPLFIGIAAVSEPLVALVLGETWLETAPLLLVLCATMPLRMAMQLYGPGLRALGRAELPLYETMASMLIVSITMWFMVDDKAMDMALAWVVATPVCALVAHLLADRVFKIGLLAIIGDLLPPLLLGTAMFGLVYSYVLWADLPAAVELISGGIIGAGFYAGGGLLLMRGRMDEALDLIRKRTA